MEFISDFVVLADKFRHVLSVKIPHTTTTHMIELLEIKDEIKTK